MERDPSEGIHQLEADISIPTDAALLERVLTRGQILAITDSVGRDELERLAAVSHETTPEMKGSDFAPLFDREAKDLGVLRKAINTATGMEKIWIMGFASDLAKALLGYADREQ